MVAGGKSGRRSRSWAVVAGRPARNVRRMRSRTGCSRRSRLAMDVSSPDLVLISKLITMEAGMTYPTTAGTGVAEEIQLAVPAPGGVALAGTLTLPAGPGPHPAVLCLPGSGKIDRESNARHVRMDLGRPLATALARQGIASLRYDRRGAGATPGDWHTVGFLDNRADAAAALRALRDHPEIQSRAVGVLGRSEGAVHAMWLAAHAQPAAAVLLAGYARPGAQAVRWQGGRLADTLPRLIRPLLSRLATRQLTRLAATTADTARIGGMPINARWWREQLAFVFWLVLVCFLV